MGSDDDEATSAKLPQLLAAEALNHDNRLIPLARATGTTAALAAPADGNLITGRSALICVAGESPASMVLRSPVGGGRRPCDQPRTWPPG